MDGTTPSNTSEANLSALDLRTGPYVHQLATCMALIYTGKQDGVHYEFGLGGDVVLGLLDQISVPPYAGHKIYFDNYFTSYQLMSHLRHLGYNAVATVRENRCGKCPVKSVNSIKKEPRGSYDYRSSDDVLVIRWNDNAVVTIAANFGSVAEGKVMRWSNAEKKKVQVPRPTGGMLQNTCTST